MKRWIVFLSMLFILIALSTVLAILNPSLAEVAPSEDTAQNTGVFAILQDYGEISALQNELQSDVSTGFEPLTIDYEDVQVTVDEILYDGLWMFAAAEITPKDPDKVLVIPGSASPNDPVAGIYGENARNDMRSFIDAAKEDGKRLLSVYAYPSDYVGEYAMDYRQRPDDASVFLSCGEIKSSGTLAAITWSVEIYEIDLDTMRSTELIVEESDLQEVRSIREPILHEYQLVSQIDAPFTSLTVMETALTTYVLPRWVEEEDRYMFSVEVFDESGEPLPQGTALDTRSVVLNEIPDRLTIELDGDCQLVFERVSP